MADSPDRPPPAHRRAATAYGIDPIRRDMRDFARELLDRLDAHRRAGDLESLAIFATPQMLALIRNEMPRTLAGTVFLERDLNLLRLSEEDLREVVKGEIANHTGGAIA